MFWFQMIVILAYGALSGLEFMSFYARLAGRNAGTPVSGYAQQNIVLMVSRFGSLLMLPTLGYLIDMRLSTLSYLRMVFVALILATTISSVIYFFRGKLINRFSRLLNPNSPFFQIRTFQGRVQYRFFWPSVCIYFAYGMAFFISYFAALLVPEFRTTLANSAVILNAGATVLLSVYLEPKFSRVVDNGSIEEMDEALRSLLLGRLLAIGFVSPILTVAVYIFFTVR